ncbi:MAG: hypothetical protein QNL64_02640 [Porticoccus sp.]
MTARRERLECASVSRLIGNEKLTATSREFFSKKTIDTVDFKEAIRRIRNPLHT